LKPVGNFHFTVPGNFIIRNDTQEKIISKSNGMKENLNKAMSEAVRESYRSGQEDETLEPLVLTGKNNQPVGRIQDRDAVIFYNIRGEREVELTRSLTEKKFSFFPVNGNLRCPFATMIEYQPGLNVRVAFPSEETVRDTLSEILSRQNLRQAKITEAEKAAHVGYFLGGKRSDPFPGEERIVIPTRKDVSLFDEAPEMSIDRIADAIVDKVRDEGCSFIFANFPNVDVVGHIENEPAVIRAIEAVDRCTGLVVHEAARAGMTVIVTADHGTVEKWLYPDGAVDTGHTDSPVPFILIHPAPAFALRAGGGLTDIAPTVLELMGIAKPPQMTGRSLIEPPRQGGVKPCRRLLLLLLDGWGYNERTEGNLIAGARTPTMDRLLQTCPWTTLEASGEAVGLPAGTVGNSEAGHLHIGAGRRIYADRVRIDRAIQDGSFFRNAAFLDVMRSALAAGAALHLIGIVSFFSSHGSLSHLLALMEMAKKEGLKEVFIHAMLGRRGELPESGANYIRKIEEKADELGLGRVVSVIGRYWSMDREENWDRIEKTYRMLVQGEGTPVRDTL
jgi:2,3-bisphosphoglycerate-independent phosphoglycerate mutase